MLVLLLMSNYLQEGPGIKGGMPSVGVFAMDPSLIYANFGENHGKLGTARLTSATGNSTWHLPSTAFERRTAQSQVGPGRLLCEKNS